MLTATLNDSQKRHAIRIGISNEEYQQHVINRLEEMRVKALPKTFRDPKNKLDKIVAKNPILIIGAGESYKRDLDKCKTFKGKTICFEVNFNTVVEFGIIPDYVLTLEIYVRPHFFNDDNLEKCKEKSIIIASASTHDIVKKMAHAHDFPFERWISKEEPRFANVGTFAMVYAKEVLRADKIFLVGFEHDGVSENKKTFEWWQYDFWYFVSQWPKELIVNCTNGGALYYQDYILDSTLDSLVIGD